MYHASPKKDVLHHVSGMYQQSGRDEVLMNHFDKAQHDVTWDKKDKFMYEFFIKIMDGNFIVDSPLMFSLRKVRVKYAFEAPKCSFQLCK